MSPGYLILALAFGGFAVIEAVDWWLFERALREMRRAHRRDLDAIWAEARQREGE